MALTIHRRVESVIARKLPWLPSKYILPLLAVALVGIPSLTALAFSYGPFVSTQAESGTLSGGATFVSDASASNGQSLKFSTPGGCTNPLHEPGGDDGFGTCWPDENNTGVPAGTVLSAYAGPCNVTTANTVINAKTIDCFPLMIRAANVTVTNSQLNGPITIDTSECGQNYSFNISDSRIHVDNIQYKGMGFCNYTATRVNVTGGNSMAWCANCTIQDSYLHSPLEDPEGAANNTAAHNSTVRVASNATIRHNTLWCKVVSYPQPNGLDSSGCSANQTAYSHDGAAPSNSLMEKNLYMPTTGGYCAYGGSTAGDLSSVYNIDFKDNIFKRGTDPSDKGTFICGYYGAITSWDGDRPGSECVNNRWDDGTLMNCW